MTLQITLQQLGWLMVYFAIFFVACSVITSCIKQIISTYFLAKLAYTVGTKQDASDVLQALNASLHNGKWTQQKAERTSPHG